MSTSFKAFPVINTFIVDSSEYLEGGMKINFEDIGVMERILICPTHK
jgi:hypothetical protein